LVPSSDSSDDLFWIGGPDERLWIVVGFGDEAIDGDLQVGEGSEDTAFEPAP
jgi:hypothetical protein